MRTHLTGFSKKSTLGCGKLQLGSTLIIVELYSITSHVVKFCNLCFSLQTNFHHLKAAANAEAYNAPWNVAGIASTPTTPVWVYSAAGLTAGSMPTKGTSGNFSRKVFNAAAEAVLQATTINFASCASKKRVMPSEKLWICSIGRGPYGTCPWSPK